MEHYINYLYLDSNGVFSKGNIVSFRNLDHKRDDFLIKEEIELCLKIRALWIIEGDKSTKLFHHFSSYRKNEDHIYKI